MIELGLYLLAFSVASVVLGGGWACVCPTNGGRRSLLWWSAVTTMCSQSIVWGWVIGLNGSVSVGRMATLILAAVGWAVAWRRGELGRWRESPGRHGHTALVATTIAVVLLGSAPNIASPMRLTVAFRVGSDAIGNAVAAEAIASGQTRSSIEADLRAATGATTSAQLTSGPAPLMYRSASLQQQIRGEFIVAGLRWGFSGTAAAVLSSGVGRAHIWQVLSALAAFAQLVTALGVVSLMRARNRGTVPTCCAVVLVCLGTSTLNGWHEGGVAQVWSVPASILMFYAAVTPAIHWRSRVALLSLATATILSGYSDLLLLLVLVFGGALIISLLERSRVHTRRFGLILVGLLFGVVLTGPFLVAFVSYLPRRLADASVGGWQMPRWTGPSESLGLVDAYSQRYQGEVPRPTGWASMLLGVTDAAAVGFFAAYFVRYRHRIETIFCLSCCVVCALVFGKSRLIEHSSNYQYFKAVGCLVPLIWLALCASLALWRRTETSSPWLSVERVFVVLAAGMVTVAAANYSRTFRSEGFQLAPTLAADALRGPAAELLRTSNVFAPGSLEIQSLSAVSPMYWLSRPGPVETQSLAGRILQPLTLLVLSSDCPRWKCLQTVQQGRISDLSATIRLVRLADDSTALTTLQGSDAAQQWHHVVEAMFQSAGGGSLTLDYRPAD